jgi:hypothetical protein
MVRSSMMVHLGGDLDQARLDALRSSLGLRPEGRLGDAYDEIQGRRVDEVPGGEIEVLLERMDIGGPWSFHVYGNTESPVDAHLAALEAELTATALSSGLTVERVDRRTRTVGA